MFSGKISLRKKYNKFLVIYFSRKSKNRQSYVPKKISGQNQILDFHTLLSTTIIKIDILTFNNISFKLEMRESQGALQDVTEMVSFLDYSKDPVR